MNLVVKNVSFAYKNENILNEVSFEINTGKIVGLIGANGAGKTTILKNVMGFLKPNNGKIFVDEKKIIYKDNLNFPITYVPDSPCLYENLTVQEHVKFLNKIYGFSSEKGKCLLELFELSKHKNKIPYQLSKGNKQKLMIICSVMKNFEFLFADEPFEGLDPEQINNLKFFLCKLRQEKKGIVISTHLLNMVEDICDEYIIVYQGNIIAQGDIQQIKEKFQLNCNSIEEIYLEIMGMQKAKEE